MWTHALHPVLDFSQKLPDVAEQSAMEGALGGKSELFKGAAISYDAYCGSLLLRKNYLRRSIMRCKKGG